MKNLLDILSEKLGEAFEKAGYDRNLGRATISNRPDLCEYQCNGAMAGAKQYKCAPIAIAQAVADLLKEDETFSEIAAVNPGFINIKIKDEFLSKHIEAMAGDEKLGVELSGGKTAVIDYGGANVAKPLHVGHLRSAIIGETIKRLKRFKGDTVIGDVHLGDWGLQMGLIIEQLRCEQPDLVYFDESFMGEYPDTPPFTLSELEQIYPKASARSKEDDDFKEKAQTATLEMQKGKRGYRAIWKHILDVSIPDLKKNYDNMKVEFELWKGESSAEEFIAPMVEDMINNGYAHESQGAIVVDVKEESDQKEIPPCIIKKSDGASLYATSDLATIIQRKKDYNPDEIIYVADKRQEMHFTQVFRTAKKTKIVDDSIDFSFLGFGTMNGRDGKPFKTRDGGVMRLETLISDINKAVYDKMMENREMDEAEALEISKTVGLSALKYGDLSNQASKDYVFDLERFTSFEGDTGPYILYTIVRIKAILRKYEETGKSTEGLSLNRTLTPAEKQLMLELSKFSSMIDTAYCELAPHKICAYIYDLANVFNSFYHENKIMTEEDADKQAGFIALLLIAKKALEISIEILGFDAPDRM
ncbi:MAG: arginine--tRNA ligase [Lachnospiraceae bacterium]|nr:arginine--tRNA ligase [Lachnospiraceae bacterium]